MSNSDFIPLTEAVIHAKIQQIATNDVLVSQLVADKASILLLRNALNAMGLADFKSIFQCAGSVAFLRGDKPVVLRMNTGDGKSLVWHLSLYQKPPGFIVIVSSPLVSLNFDQFTQTMTRLGMTTENVVNLDGKTTPSMRALLYERLRTHDPTLHVVFASTAMIEMNRNFQDALLCANKFAFVRDEIFYILHLREINNYNYHYSL